MGIWDQAFEELRRPHLEEGEKMAKKDYDKDGKVETGSQEYLGSRDKAIKKAMGKKEVEEGIDFKGARREQARRDAIQAEKDNKSPSSKDRRLAMGKFRPGASSAERAEGGRDAMREKGTSPTKNGKKMFERSDWRSDFDFFTEADCESGSMKPKKGIKNKITINPEIKTEAVAGGPVMKPGSGLGGGKPVYPAGQEPKKTGAKLPQLPLANSFEPEGEEISEREMTSGEMSKEKRLKKKYDPSNMKASMKKQYGPERGEQVYFATIRKKAMEQFENKEFAGNYEGPLYAPHPDIEEGYKEIDKKKETAMYRRAGNLARTALSSRGPQRQRTMTQSSNIVSAITRQKEKERFDKIGKDPKHQKNYKEAAEAELDYYLDEMCGPKHSTKKKSKLQQEAEKILERMNDEPGERDDRPDVKAHNKAVGYKPRSRRPRPQDDPRYGTMQDKSGKWKY